MNHNNGVSRPEITPTWKNHKDADYPTAAIKTRGMTENYRFTRKEELLPPWKSTKVLPHHQDD